MLKRLAVLVALMGLGCAGLTEKVVEVSTGASMEISDNGDVTMEMPDGTKIVTQQKAAAPEGFPLPLPYDGAESQALVTTTNPNGDTYWVVTYEMNAPREEISATYKAWLDANATDVKHNKETVTGIVSETLMGTVGDGGVLITLTEAFGANSVSAIWAPKGLDGVNSKGL